MLKISIVENHNETGLALDSAGLIPMAERELAAFFNAVTELFGSELAQLSAEDWLQELTAIDALPASAREWRRILARCRIPVRDHLPDLLAPEGALLVRRELDAEAL